MSGDKLEAILNWLDSAELQHENSEGQKSFRVILPEPLLETLVSHLQRLRSLADMKGSVVNGAIQGTDAAIAAAVARAGMPPEGYEGEGVEPAPVGPIRKLPQARKVCVIFDGPPGPTNDSGRFVEVENESGESVKVGTWRERDDGYWSLDFEVATDRLIDELRDNITDLWHSSESPEGEGSPLYLHEALCMTREEWEGWIKGRKGCP